MGSNSRPSTPSPLSLSTITAGGESSILSQKLNKVIIERNNAHQHWKPVSSSEEDVQNGKNDSWQEDQEVSDINGSRRSTYSKEPEKADLSRKDTIHRLQFLKIQPAEQNVQVLENIFSLIKHNF